MRKLMLSLITCLVAGQVAAQQTELQFSTFTNREHRIDKLLIVPMEQQYEGLVNGSSRIVVYPESSLVKSTAEQLEGVLAGASDFTFSLPAYTPDHFPRTMMFELPGLYKEPLSATEAIWDNIDQLMPDFEGLHLIALWANDPTILISRDRPIRTLADIRGMRIRASSPAHARILRAWGAEPVTGIPYPKMYEALKNGEVEAILIAGAALQGVKLYEIANFVTVNLPESVGTMYIVMNKATYDGLSPAEREVIDSFSGREPSMAAAQAYSVSTPAALEVARENGVQIIELTSYQRQAFEERFPYSPVEVEN